MDAPYNLPDGLDLFSWSLPFVAEKVNKLMVHIINVCTPAELKRLADNPNLIEELAQMSEEAAHKIRRKLEFIKKVRQSEQVGSALTLLRHQSEEKV